MLPLLLRASLVSCGAAACLLFASCGPESQGPIAKDLSRIPECEFGKPIFFGGGGGGDQIKLNGWAGAEPPFTWTDGVAASVGIRVPMTDAMVQLRFKMAGMNVERRLPFQRVDVFVNGQEMARWRVSDENVFTLTLPVGFVTAAKGLVVVDFYMPNANSPSSLGIGGDLRRLGIRMSDLTILKIAQLEYEKPIWFGAKGEGGSVTLNGWGWPEPFFTWTEGNFSSLIFQVPQSNEPVQLRFKMAGMNVRPVLPFQNVDVLVNGEKTESWQVSDENDFILTIPQRFVANPTPLITIDFQMPDAASPASISGGGDGRRLGIRMVEMTLLKPGTSGPAKR